MISSRRSTRKRYAPGSKPKRAPPLPKLPSEEAPEPWPPKNLPAGLVYHPLAREAKCAKRSKLAPSCPSSSSSLRGSSEETLVNIDDVASGSTISARSSPGISEPALKYEHGIRGDGDGEEVSTWGSEFAQGRCRRVWDQRRIDRESEVYEKGEPRCEWPVSVMRTSLGEGGRKEIGGGLKRWDEGSRSRSGDTCSSTSTCTQ